MYTNMVITFFILVELWLLQNLQKHIILAILSFSIAFWV
jgi:hypothetical protein